MYESNSGCSYHVMLELPFHIPTSLREDSLVMKLRDFPSVEALGFIPLMPFIKTSGVGFSTETM